MGVREWFSRPYEATLFIKFWTHDDEVMVNHTIAANTIEDLSKAIQKFEKDFRHELEYDHFDHQLKECVMNGAIDAFSRSVLDKVARKLIEDGREDLCLPKTVARVKEQMEKEQEKGNEPKGPVR